MIYHLTPLDEWLAAPGRPYAPAGLTADTYVHCSPDEAVTIAVANTFFRETDGMLVALLIDEMKLDVMLRWEAADPEPPPGVAASTLFPHVYGPIPRDAVEGVLEVLRDENGRYCGLVPLTKS